MMEKLFEELAQLEQVEALVLGGSRAGNFYDDQSDYDVYVYLSEPLDETVRRELFAKYCRYMEIGNHFWELEDDGILNNGIEIEFIYRKLDDFYQDIQSVVKDFQVHNAYTTAMWHNLLNSKIIFDRQGRYKKMQDTFDIPYPQELKNAIVERQLQLLKTHMPAFPNQIRKAFKRRDFPAINHRVTEFLASYFEVIFALNEQTHPGEKRMITYAKQNCNWLPKDFEENLELLFKHLFDDKNTIIIDKMMIALQDLVNQIK